MNKPRPIDLEEADWPPDWESLEENMTDNPKPGQLRLRITDNDGVHEYDVGSVEEAAQICKDSLFYWEVLKRIPTESGHCRWQVVMDCQATQVVAVPFNGYHGV